MILTTTCIQEQVIFKGLQALSASIQLHLVSRVIWKRVIVADSPMMMTSLGTLHIVVGLDMIGIEVEAEREYIQR